MKHQLIVTLSLLLGLSMAACAAVPPMINYQGKLMQPSGAPVPDGTYSMVFAIYDVPTGGTALWSEANPSVQVKGGLFAVLLGSINNLPANIFDGPGKFFGVKVGNDPEMAPRQQVASVAYAQVAGTVAASWQDWTPVIRSPGGSAGSFAYDNGKFRYCRIGKMVFLVASFRITNLGSWSSTLWIDLPVPRGTHVSGSEGALSGWIVPQYANPTVSSRGFPICAGDEIVFSLGILNAFLDWAHMQPNDVVNVQGFYEVD